MIRFYPRAWAALSFFLSLAMSLAACNQKHALKLGEVMPPVVLPDARGKTMALPNDIQGKTALVRFWSITCPSCSKELLKALDELYRKYRDRGVTIVTINVAPPPESDQEFRKLSAITYPILIDRNSEVSKRFGVKELPTTFILDEQGIVREKITGEAPIELFERLVTRVLYKGGFYD